MESIKKSYNCMLCGDELEYFQEYKKVTCSYCNKSFETNVLCREGHYVCDTCHSITGMDLIERYCKETDETDPIKMAIQLMKSPGINMHGPEHHYLVPAVLLTSYYNIKGESKNKIKKLMVAKKRASEVPGGICGFYGNCGAAVGTGIFISIIMEATPLTKESWGMANMMTGKSLISIARTGGPRCCKRNTFTAIKEASDFIYNNFEIKLYDYENEIPLCGFKSKNKECIHKDCPYFI